MTITITQEDYKALVAKAVALDLINAQRKENSDYYISDSERDMINSICKTIYAEKPEKVDEPTIEEQQLDIVLPSEPF